MLWSERPGARDSLTPVLGLQTHYLNFNYLWRNQFYTESGSELYTESDIELYMESGIELFTECGNQFYTEWHWALHEEWQCALRREWQRALRGERQRALHGEWPWALHGMALSFTRRVAASFTRRVAASCTASLKPLFTAHSRRSGSWTFGTNVKTEICSLCIMHCRSQGSSVSAVQQLLQHHSLTTMVRIAKVAVDSNVPLLTCLWGWPSNAF